MPTAFASDGITSVFGTGGPVYLGALSEPRVSGRTTLRRSQITDNRPRPLTVEDLLEIFRRVTTRDYHQPFFDDPKGSLALYRGMARAWADLSRKIFQSQQALFYLPHSRQIDSPATSGRYAEFDADIERFVDLDQDRVVTAGAMRIFGPQGRLYENADTIQWYPFDPEPRKTLRFRAVAVGFVFNLDHLADPDGLLTAGIFDPSESPNANGPDFAKVGLRRESDARSGSRATITSGSRGLAVVRDDGRGATLRQSDIGLYLRIDDATDPENIGRVLRIVGFNDPRVESPVRSGLFPREVTVDDSPIRHQVASVVLDDGGVQTSLTANAGDDTGDDVPLLPAAPDVNDAIYFASFVVPSSFVVQITTPGAGDWVLAWEYWNGSWASISVTDGSSGFRNSGTRSVTINTAPNDWLPNAVDGVTGYHVRARVTAVTTVTAQPLAGRVWCRIAAPLSLETGSVSWSILDWTDLDFRLVRIEAPSGGRDDDLQLLGDERGLSQRDGETDDEFRLRAAQLEDAVSPNAIRRTINRTLAPFGFTGQAFDVQDDRSGPWMDGLFADRDPADYQSTHPFRVAISRLDAYGTFFVRIPFLGDGGFGFAHGGPVIEGPRRTLAPAMDAAFLGRTRSARASVYASLYATLKRIRGGGIRIVMYRDPELNATACPQEET